MKIDPVRFVLEKKNKFEEKIYFVTGNETTLMEAAKDKIILNLSKNGSYGLEKIKNITLRKNDISLFNEQRLYLISDISGLNKDALEEIIKGPDKYIIFNENSPKTKSLKNDLTKRSDVIVLECYELSRNAKAEIIKTYFEDIGLKISNDIYWKLVDNLDNKFMLLMNDLVKMLELKELKGENNYINQIFSNNSEGVERVFFEIFKNKQELIDSYNKKITNDNELNNLFYSIKKFSNLIIESGNRGDFEKNIPVYLFKERGFLIKLYEMYNIKKKKALLNLIYKTELTIRKGGGLSLILGLIFLLKFRKISTS